MPLGFLDRQINPDRIDPPNNDEMFEDVCRDLAREAWKDPSANRVGRSGQNQFGIDVRGFDENGKITGIQCRKKDLLLKGKLTENDIRTVVADAKKHNPPLERLIIATTLPRDINLQNIAFSITVENKKTGLFTVEIWSWEDIKDLFSKNRKTLAHYFPEFKLTEDTWALNEKIDQFTETAKAILKEKTQENGPSSNTGVQINAETVNIGTVVNTSDSGQSGDDKLSIQIDNARELLHKSNPKSALAALEDLKKIHWSTASNHSKFRILTNIAVAKVEMQQVEEGARIFLEALGYNKDDEKALCNAALAHILLGDDREGRKFVESVLKKNENNKQAYSMWVYSADEKDTLDKVIREIPKAFINDPDVAFAVGTLAKEKGNITEAKKWLEIASKENSENKPLIEATFAEVLLQDALKDPAMIIAGHLGNDMRRALEMAVEHYSKAWDVISATELSKFNLNWIINRSLANRMLGNRNKATKDVELALELDPKNSFYIKQKALLSFEEGKTEEAIEILKPIVDDPGIPEAPLMIAGFYKHARKYPEAIEGLVLYLNQKGEGGMKEEAKRLLIQLYLDTDQDEVAEKLSAEMIKEDPNNILNYIDQARILGSKGDSSKAVAVLKNGRRLVDDQTSKREVLELAEQFYHFKKYEEAGELFEKIVDHSADSRPIRQLIDCYYNTGKLKEALEICRELYQKFGPLEFITEMESNIYEEIGDLKKAKEVCEAYIEKYPKNLEMKIRLGVVNYRLGNKEDLDAFLQSEIDTTTLSFHSVMQLANLYEISDNFERSLKVVYEARRDNFNEREAHLQYVGLFLRREKNIESLLEKTKIEVGAAVTVEYQGGERHTFILEDRDDINSQNGEINKKHPLFILLLGRASGDMILEKEGQMDEQRLKIVEVKSKYVHAFQESLAAFGKLLPPSNDLQSIYIEDKKDGKMPEGFQKIFDQVTKLQERRSLVEDLYKEKKITVGAVAEMMGGDIFRTWAMLLSKPDVGIWASLGTQEEKLAALNALRVPQKPKLVVDIISLLTIHELGIQDKLVEVFGRFGISQVTLDLINETVAQRKGMESKGYTTIGKEGEQFVREEVTPEQIENNAKYLIGIFDWAKRNCDVLPCSAALVNAKENKKLKKLLGKSFLETALIASEKGNILFSDDERLRSLAKIEYGVEGVWTQMLLMILSASGNLTPEEYAKLTVRLVNLNYHYTSINKEAITQAALESDWKYEKSLFSILQNLKKKNSDESSAVQVATEFISYSLSQKLIPTDKEESMVSIVLDILIEDRDKNEILSKFKKSLESSFILEPFDKEKILAIVRKWNR